MWYKNMLHFNNRILGKEEYTMFPKIALITPHTLSHRTAEETLALGYLASILRASSYAVTIVDGWLRGISSAEIVTILEQAGKPDIICISCYRSNLEQSKELLHAITERFGIIPSICGGYGPTFHDIDFLAAGFTVAVRGEAEHLIIPLVEALASDKIPLDIPGITFRNGSSIIRTKKAEPIRNLDDLAFPARDEIGFVSMRKNPAHVCTSRGCEAHCTFCSVFTFARDGSKDHRWRHRSIQNIVDELRLLYECHGITHIKFVDDSFLEPPRDEKWVTDFGNTLARYDLPLRFRTQIRADRLTESIVGGLKQAGWFATSIGIENAAPSALRRMGKAASAEDNWGALELLKRHSIYAQVGMILFDDATTPEELEINHRFLAHHDWIVTKGIFTEMFAAEGTPFTRKLSRQGLIRSDKIQQNHRYEVRDVSARRVYQMLKTWHRSHSGLYDWVIDSITAPKVLPDAGYASVHAVCRLITGCDTNIFRRVLDHVVACPSDQDKWFITEIISEHAPFYADVWSQIQTIYDYYGLAYDGVPNPFLD